MIGVILNTYKRLHNFDRQLKAIQNQSITPSKILVWSNDCTGVKMAHPGVTFVTSSENMGVWARFSIARELGTDYYCIFDDDTIPGKFWLENCLDCYNQVPGVYAASGFKFQTKTISRETMFSRTQHGWIKPPVERFRVDWPGHAWFFSKEILYRSLSIEPEGCKTAGEDAHLAWSAQTLGMNSYIPPHNKDRTNWGSVQGGLGQDAVAAWRVPGQNDNMIRCLNYYKNLGWKFEVDE